MNIGHVKFIRPESPLLQKWIKGYYVHQADEKNFFTKLTFYQNITSTISIYKDTSTTSKGRHRKQTFQKDAGYSSLLVGLVDKYQEVEFYGPLNRLAIVFYPLGLNQFLRKPLGDFLKIHYSDFHYFDEAFHTLLPKVYDEPKLESKRNILDQFFLEHFEELQEPTLDKAVEILVKDTDGLKVQTLANQLKVNRRTLLRKFKKHLGYSIEDYISVIKFRKALLSYQKGEGQKSMTDIALESSYYDQADFNHHIKSRVELTPTQLFEQLNIIDNTLFWKL